MICGRIIM